MVRFLGCPVQGLRDAFHEQFLPEPQALFVKGAGSDFQEWSEMTKQPMEAFRDLFCNFIDTPVDGTGARCMVKTHLDDSSKAAAEALKRRKMSEGNFDWLAQVEHYSRMHKAHRSNMAKQSKQQTKHQRKEDGNGETLSVQKWHDWTWKEWQHFLDLFRQKCAETGLSIKCKMSRSLSEKIEREVSEARQTKGEGWNPSTTFLFEVLTHKNQMMSVPLVDKEDVAKLFLAHFADKPQG